MRARDGSPKLVWSSDANSRSRPLSAADVQIPAVTVYALRYMTVQDLPVERPHPLQQPLARQAVQDTIDQSAHRPQTITAQGQKWRGQFGRTAPTELRSIYDPTVGRWASQRKASEGRTRDGRTSDRGAVRRAQAKLVCFAFAKAVDFPGVVHRAAKQGPPQTTSPPIDFAMKSSLRSGDDRIDAHARPPKACSQNKYEGRIRDKRDVRGPNHCRPIGNTSRGPLLPN
jgi:hypothetical protein